MAGIAPKRPLKALHLLAYAWLVTKPRTIEEAQACNAQFARTRRFLIHEPATEIAVLGVEIDEQEFDLLRDDAVAEMEGRCGACGRCRLFGIKLP